MEDHEHIPSAHESKPVTLQTENQPDSHEQSQKKSVDYDAALKDLNSKIMRATRTICDQSPELCDFLEEMPITIPSESNPEMTLSHLLSYYESLNEILNKYQQEHPVTDSARNDATK